MAFRCDKCGKGRLITQNVAHKRGVAGGQWKKKAPKTRKISLPNLHAFSGIYDGRKGHWKFCTKCLRIVKKDVVFKKTAKVAPVKPAPLSDIPRKTA